MDTLEKLIEETRRRGKHLFQRHSPDIRADFRRGWSAWMGTYTDEYEHAVDLACSHYNWKEIAGALDVPWRVVLEYAGSAEAATPADVLDALWDIGGFEDAEAFYEEAAARLVEAGILGVDPATGMYAVVHYPWGVPGSPHGLSAYLVETPDDLIPTDSLPVGEGVQAVGEYELIANLGGGWYLFAADDYVEE